MKIKTHLTKKNLIIINFESLMVIEIPCTVGNFTLKIVNDFLNCPLRNSKFHNKNGKKQVLFWNLRFDIVFDIDKHCNNFENNCNISNEFENELLRLFNTVYKMIEQEIPVDIQINFYKKIESIFALRSGRVDRNYKKTQKARAQNTAKKVATLFNKYKEKYFDMTFKSIVDNHGNKDLDNYNVIDSLDWEKVKIPKCNKYCQTTQTPKIKFELKDYMRQHNRRSYKIKLMDFKVETARKRNCNHSFVI